MKRCTFIFVFLAALPLPVRALDAPEVRRLGDAIAITLPQDLLHKEIVRDQLDSGLTTTFLVDAKFRRHARQARIEIRWDLWDETYLARIVNRTGRGKLLRIGTLQDLETWWKDQPLSLFAVGPDVRGKLTLELRVLPYSPSEEQETREWMGEAAGLSSRSGTAASGTQPAGGPIVDALIATSIGARSVLTYRWTIGFGP